MTITIAGLMAAAAAVLFWPKAKAPGPSMFTPSPAEVSPPAPRVPTFLEATGNLANVRRRLVATELLGDPERKAIDVLQLALTSGSDKE